MLESLKYMSERELWWASFLVGFIMAAAVAVVGLGAYLVVTYQPHVISSVV